MNNSVEVRIDKQQYFFCRIFLISNLSWFLGVFPAVLYFLVQLQSGKEAIRDVLLASSAAYTILLFPDVISTLFKVRLIATFSAMSVIFFAAAGFFIRIPWYLWPVFAAVLAIVQLTLSRDYISTRQNTPVKVLALLILFSLSSGYIAGKVYYKGYRHPLYIEQISSGTVSRDLLFHAALSNVFKNQQVVSTALHGNPELHYHSASHKLFAGLSELTGVSSLLFYNLYYPLLFIPLFFKAFFLLSFHGLTFFKQSVSIHYLFISVLSGSLFIHTELIFRQFWPFISESNTVALSLCFFYLADRLFLEWDRPGSTSVHLFWLLLDLLILSLLIVSKISVAYILFALILLVYLREHSARSPWVLSYALSGILMLILSVLYYGKSAIHHRESGRFLFTLFSIRFWFWTLLIYVMYSFCRRNADVFHEVLPQLRFFLKLLVIACIFGTLPALAPGIGSMVFSYFASIQCYLGLAFAVPVIACVLSACKKFNLSGFHNGLLLLSFYLVILSPAMWGSACKKVLQYSRTLAAECKDQKRHRLVLDLENFKFDPQGVFYIPRSNISFWSWQEKNSSNSFIVPALSGMPQLYGFNSSVIPGYGFPEYSGIRLPKDFNEVKAEAKRLGYKKIYLIENDQISETEI